MVISMFFLLCVARSATPLTSLPRKELIPPRWSIQLCVTLLPAAVGSILNTQSHQLFPKTISPKENFFGASHTLTLTFVPQAFLPFLFRPLKIAPTAGPVAPLAHLPPWFSGDHSPMRGKSVTSAHTLSGDAENSRVTETGAGCVISQP